MAKVIAVYNGVPKQHRYLVEYRARGGSWAQERKTYRIRRNAIVSAREWAEWPPVSESRVIDTWTND